MGKVIDFAQAKGRPVAPGVVIVPLLDGADSAEIAAVVVRLAAGAQHETTAPAGSDQYLYVLSGAARRAGAPGGTQELAPATWVILQEGTRFALSGAAEILSVAVPSPGAGRGGAGFAGGIKVMRVGELPVVDLPEEKKRRVYLATKETTGGSTRGHAMIVHYTGDTVTKRHHHPNAESLFVILDGKVEFLVDGTPRVLGAGEAAFFPMNDSHGLRSADAKPLHFLEFHIPGAFVTSYDE